jgi:hypothetical protein
LIGVQRVLLSRTSLRTLLKLVLRLQWSIADAAAYLNEKCLTSLRDTMEVLEYGYEEACHEVGIEYSTLVFSGSEWW